MKRLSALFVGLIFTVSACEKVSPDAADLSVHFSWEGVNYCGHGNPEVSIGEIPDKTKFLKFRMYDHAYAYDHGTVTLPYTGKGIIARNTLNTIQNPCPPGSGSPGRYKITIKALDEEKTVIGVGSKERFYPE